MDITAVTSRAMSARECEAVLDRLRTIVQITLTASGATLRRLRCTIRWTVGVRRSARRCSGAPSRR